LNLDWDDCAAMLAAVLADTIEGLRADHTWLSARPAALEGAAAGRGASKPLRRRFAEWSKRRAFLLSPVFARLCEALGSNAGAWRAHAAPWLHLPVNGRLLREALRADTRR
jgi:hypothetical protein